MTFAPTPLAAENLKREGKDPAKIYITGNIVIDAMQHTVKDEYTHPELDWVGDGKLIFITAHRRENLEKPMHHMFRAIRRVLDEHPECKAVYPIHMNPVVREAAEAELDDCDQIHIIEPIIDQLAAGFVMLAVSTIVSFSTNIVNDSKLIKRLKEVTSDEIINRIYATREPFYVITERIKSAVEHTMIQD